MSATDEEIEFLSVFPPNKRYGAETKLDKRLKAERRAQLSERQLSRGGRVRDAQMNFRTTPAVKAMAATLAGKLGLSIAETVELAISGLASQHGVKDDA